MKKVELRKHEGIGSSGSRGIEGGGNVRENCRTELGEYGKPGESTLGKLGESKGGKV